MGNSPFEQVNLKQSRRLLNALSDLARESSMTGSLRKGARTGVRQYNGLLNHLSETGLVPEGLFMHLDEDEDHMMDDLGVACILLNAYLEEDDVPASTPPLAPAPPSSMVLHGDSQELHEMRELRELLREQRENR